MPSPLKLSMQSTDCVTLPFTNNRSSSKQLQKKKATFAKQSKSSSKANKEDEQQSIQEEMEELRVIINQVKQGILERNQITDEKMKNQNEAAGSEDKYLS